MGIRMCGKCGQVGHYAPTCGRPRRVRRGPGGPRRCSLCSLPGHDARTCYTTHGDAVLVGVDESVAALNGFASLIRDPWERTVLLRVVPDLRGRGDLTLTEGQGVVLRIGLSEAEGWARRLAGALGGLGGQ